ncbi:MAG: hypothetical protein ACJ72W_28560 [Actinoallomurus sp.]
MGLIVFAADKGAPGVTTAAVAIAAVWPRPVVLAECDQGGGDLVYRLPAEDGGMLNPARGLLSLAATARRGLRPDQIWEHTQRLVGGLNVVVGLTNAEQAQGLTWLWSPLGRAFASLTAPGPYAEEAASGPHANGTTPGAGSPAAGSPVTGAGPGVAPAVTVDVVADCGRLGAGSAVADLLREASAIVLFTRATLEHVAHLRERINALASELGGHAAPPIGVVVVADPREYRASITEVGRIISNAKLPATVLGGFALDPKGAEMLRGRWGGRLDRSLLIRSARQIAGGLAARAAGGPETGREAQGAAGGSQSR